MKVSVRAIPERGFSRAGHQFKKSEAKVLDVVKNVEDPKTQITEKQLAELQAESKRGKLVIEEVKGDPEANGKAKDDGKEKKGR